MRTNPGERNEMFNNKLHRIRKDPKLKRNQQPIKLIRPVKEETVVCPFDPYHIIDRNYLDRHIMNCASSSNHVNNRPNVKPPGVVPLESYADVTVPVMKDWEEEEVSTYDPYINTQNRNVLRYLVLVPKSQRKVFRQNERLRIQLLETSERYGPHMEVNDIIKNLGEDSLWEILLMYMKRLDVKCCETLIDNFDFEKLVISETSTTLPWQDEKKPMERVLNIEVEKLIESAPILARGRRGSISDCITSQFGSLVLGMPQE